MLYAQVWDVLGDSDFVRCIHSMGLPRPVKTRVINHWPCNPEKVRGWLMERFLTC